MSNLRWHIQNLTQRRHKEDMAENKNNKNAQNVTAITSFWFGI
jgi:hypothetical protein